MIYRNSGGVSGQSPLNFKNYSGSIQDYLIEGNTSQNGTPTPEAPVDVVGCGVRTGNLFDYAEYAGTYMANAGLWEYTGTIGTVFRIPSNEKTVYTLSLSKTFSLSVYRIATVDTDSVPTINNPITVTDIVRRTSAPNSYSFTTPAGSKYILFQVNASDASEVKAATMLNSGSTALPYEPYGYKIPFTVNSTEYPIYLGEAQTTRRIKKLVLTGEENWNGSSKFRIGLSGQIGTIAPICTHYRGVTTASYGDLANGRVTVNGGINQTLVIYDTANQSSLTAWKSYLASQYAAGTPVTVWYVLAKPEIGIVNEPLMKIGSYADSISKTQSNLPIPTISGQNTLTIPTTISPSNISLTLDQKEIGKIYEGGKKEVELSGVPPISFNAIGSQVEDYLIEGNTSQNGTPTPDAPVDVVGVGKRTENLAPPLSEWVDGYVTSEGIIHAPSDVNKEKSSDYIPVKTGAAYIFHIVNEFPIGTNGPWKAIGWYAQDKTFISRASSNGKNALSANTPSNAVYCRLSYRTYSQKTNPMLNLGSTALPYEPYGFKLPITVNGTEYPIYLGQVETTRRIKKLVLTGEENTWAKSGAASNTFYFNVSDYLRQKINITICSHYTSQTNINGAVEMRDGNVSFYANVGQPLEYFYVRDSNFATVADLKSYLQQQYAAGTPVTVWYVLKTLETAVVNEPLMKIGNYADSISKTQSNLPIPITTGSDTLSIETTIQPSNITINYNKQTKIAEVYGGIGENHPIYYMNRTIEGTSPIMFKGLGKDLKDYLICGNTSQNGTPTPEAPVDVVGCGVWDATAQQYKLPITVNGTEHPIYLGQVETTRRIKKLVFDGTESWNWSTFGNNTRVYTPQIVECLSLSPAICTHFDYNVANVGYPKIGEFVINSSKAIIFGVDGTQFETAADFKTYLATQYAAGTPVTVWYVLAEPETGIVNEPLHKIGDYADTIGFAQTGETIPTTAGSNTLSVNTTIQPSSMSITGNIKPKDYGQLLDVNNIEIYDKNGTPIFIKGGND